MTVDNKGYIAPEGSDHMQEEEATWLKIISDANPVKGMLLVFIQKLCSAFHELAPAFESNALSQDSVAYVKERLIARADSVIERLRINGMGALDGARELVKLRDRLKTVSKISEIVTMSEEVHLINHRLCDAMVPEQIVPAVDTGEKREFPRFPLDVTVDYSMNAIARTKDLGLGGVCLITDKPLVQSVVISLLFHLPGEEEIEAFGKVRWSKQASEHLWENGVEFDDISEKHRSVIERYFTAP